MNILFYEYIFNISWCLNPGFFFSHFQTKTRGAWRERKLAFSKWLMPNSHRYWSEEKLEKYAFLLKRRKPHQNTHSWGVQICTSNSVRVMPFCLQTLFVQRRLFSFWRLMFIVGNKKNKKKFIVQHVRDRPSCTWFICCRGLKFK